MIKVITENTTDHFAFGTVHDFEKVIAQAAPAKTVVSKHDFFSRWTARIIRAVPFKIKMVWLGPWQHFVVLMSIGTLWKCFPFFLFAQKRYIYLFDSWPRDHNRIKDLAVKLALDQLFISSSQTVGILRQKGMPCPVQWVPEGIAVSEYKFRDYKDKDIDVLNFGRKWDLYHQKIVSALEQAGKRYLYEQKPQQLLFPQKSDFVDGLARAKVSVCIPRNITHPEIAGKISTMTLRYLESMASKCLIIGIIPEEMRNLFDYSPIIEIDMEHAANQILEVLNQFDRYIPLIEMNYATVKSKHQWKNRWDSIKEMIDVQLQTG